MPNGKFLFSCFLAIEMVATLASAEPSRIDGAAYDSLYPFYAEFCGLSQIRKKPGFGALVEGGTGGHGVLYLKGACRDKSVPYPKIAMCDELALAPGADRGVGISVNSDFKNANWTAVENKDFFFYGGLLPGQRLNTDAYLYTRYKAEEMGILNGIRYHDELFQNAPQGMSREIYMYEDSMGTDYAISFGRNMYCARMPLTRGMLAKAVSFLNDVNHVYLSGQKEYEWSVYSDNCTHTAHNALSAAGVWEPLLTNQFFLIQLANLAVPVNQFVDLMERGNDLPLEDYLALYRDDYARRSLLEEDWLPTQPGVIDELIPVRHDNDFYRLDLGAMLLDFPILQPVENELDSLISEGRYTDLKTNLEFYRDRYRELQRTRVHHSLPWYQVVEHQDVSTIRKDDFEDFERKFDSYVDRQLQIVETALGRLGE